MIGTIFDIKEMAVHDGDGIRTTVFFKGCPLRCRWCHNPEGLDVRPQLMFAGARCRGCGLCRKGCDHEECRPFGRCIHVCPENCLSVSGESLTDEALAARLLASAGVLPEVFGGFTFSGGEPLMQPDFLLAVMERLKGYDLCIETSGFAPREVFDRVISRLSSVIMDIKLADPALHRKYTGQDNAVILENFRALKTSGKPCLIRTPLIPGVTDTPENLSAIREIIGDTPWEQLAYNDMAGAKYRMLGMTFPMEQPDKN